MRNFDFYEFVGIVVPGTVILVGIGALWPGTTVAALLLPTTTGAALVHVVTAYAVGHAVQGIGNLVEIWYWRLWGGMPTDWVVTRPKSAVRSTAIEEATRAVGSSKKIESLGDWHEVFYAARAKVYESGKADRVHIFNSTYGLFRGLAVCGIVFMSIAWASPTFEKLLYPLIIVLTALALYRMHHFGLRYARELHACIANLTNGRTDGS